MIGQREALFLMAACARKGLDPLKLTRIIYMPGRDVAGATAPTLPKPAVERNGRREANAYPGGDLRDVWGPVRLNGQDATNELLAAGYTQAQIDDAVQRYTRGPDQDPPDRRITVRFYGRKAGAIGVSYWMTHTYVVPASLDADHRRVALYEEGFEDISGFVVLQDDPVAK